MSSPTLLYCVPYQHGAGGAVRGVAIANRLARRFRVVMLVEGTLPSELAMSVSNHIELVQLGVSEVGHRRGDVDAAACSSLLNGLAVNKERIFDVYSRLDPCLVIIDSFPFLHSECGNVLMSLISESKSRGSNLPLVVSVADAISGGLRAKKNHDDKIAALLNDHFNAVLVPSDPAFARLEEFFRPSPALTTPVHHTAFVQNDGQQVAPVGFKERRVLVSAGDGESGNRLCRAAIEAHRLLWDADRLKMTIIPGPSLPRDEWQNLVKAAGQSPELKLVRSVQDLGTELAKVRWAVCPSDYDTACALMATKVSALVVPAGGSDATQQLDRAKKLAYWGLCHILMAQHVNGPSVASAIHQLIRFEPEESRFNLNGAQMSANAIQKLWISENLRSMLRGLGIRSQHAT